MNPHQTQGSMSATAGILAVALAGLGLTPTTAVAGTFVSPDHIVGVPTLPVAGALLAIDTPRQTTIPLNGPVGPTWPEYTDRGWRMASGSQLEADHGVSPWEPDGTVYALARNYRLNSAPGSSYTFNLADAGVDLPDGTVINAVYATWLTRGSSGCVWSYAESASGSVTVGQTGGPAADLVLKWTDSIGTVRNGNFQRVITGPITVSGGDGFKLTAVRNGNTHQCDAVVIDCTIPNQLHWDQNGSTAGAGSSTPAGTWDNSNTFWNTVSAGTGTTAAWTPGKTAVFSAGNDATDPYTVTISGTQDIGGLLFEEGTTTLTGDGLRMTANTAVSVAPGLTTTINSTISDNGAPWRLWKSGGGALIVTAANTYTGETVVGDGTLTVSPGGSLGTGNVTIASYGTCSVQNTGGAIGDNSALFLNGILNLPSGVTETVKRLYINNEPQMAGTWNATVDPLRFSGTGNLIVTENAPDLVALAAEELKQHVNGTITLTGAQIAAHKATFDARKTHFDDNAETISSIFDLIKTYDTVKGPLFVSGSTVTGFSRNDTSASSPTSISPENIHWVVYTAMQYVIDEIYNSGSLADPAKRAVIENFNGLGGYKFGSHTDFPGSCSPPANPLNTHTVSINGSFPDTFGRDTQQWTLPARKPTGAYLAPGTVGSVTVPAALVNAGYKIRIGAQSWNLQNRIPVERLERGTITYDITSTTVDVASPYGGGIYIEVPMNANAGVVSVTVTGAVRSPYFSAKSFHQTTPAEWETERTHPAPWVDFQSEKFMCQVPRKWIYNMTGAQATQLMVDWDKAMDAINSLMGFPLNRGKETMYCQTDVILRSSVHAPGYPAVNVSSNVNAEVSPLGYAGNYLVRGPATTLTAANIEFHEQGHAYFFPKFGGENESTVNLLQPAMLNRGFGKTFDEAQNGSFGGGNSYITVDTSAVAWMTVFNFSPREVPMASGETAYQHKGHAKYMDIARIFGWTGLDNYWKSFMEDDANNISYGSNTDDLLLRLSRHVGADIRPLLHFWGIHPQNPTALAAAIAAENIPPSLLIRDQLLHYKTLVPADNAAFRTFAVAWRGYQPTINGAWEEREHARQWDTTPLYGPGDQQRSEATNPGEIYNENSANDIRNRVQELVDLYYPPVLGPNPMSFEVAPTALNATSVRMIATTATAPVGPVEYYFENITNSTNSGWTANRTWDSTGLTTGLSHEFRVKARDGVSPVPNETAWSATASATPAADSTPPVPNPMAFASPPSAVDTTTITMSATAASDINGVEYYFACTVGSGPDSGWQTATEYSPDTLTPGTAYTYVVRARDAIGNTTSDSAPASVTTPVPDIINPLVSTFSPAHQAANVAVTSNLVVTFDEPVVIGSGNITLRNLTDGPGGDTLIPVTDATQVSVSGAILTINPTTNLLSGKNYAVRIDASAIDDLADNSYAGIDNDTTWTFTSEIVPYVWTQTAGNAQDWVTGSNWQGGSVPNPVSGDTIDFSTVNIANNTTLTLGADRAAALWKFGDTSGTNTWAVNAGNSMILAGTTPTIQVSQNTATLNNIVAGSDGLTKTGGGNLTLANASNTYSGGTVINSGTLQISADGNLGNTAGDITVNGSSTLRLGVSSVVTLNAGREVALNNNSFLSFAGGNDYQLTITGKVTGNGGLKLNGGGYNVLSLSNTTNDFTGAITIGGSANNQAALTVASLGDSASPVKFGNMTGNNTAPRKNEFTLSGSSAPVIFNNRYFELTATSANANANIRNNNTTAANTLTVNTDLVVSGSAVQQLYLMGSNTGNNTFAGKIIDGSGTAVVNLLKVDSGKWILSGANTHTGTTTNSAGILSIANSLALQNSPLDTTASVAGTATVGLRTTVTALTLGGLIGNKNLAATGGVFSTTSGGYGSVTDLTLNPGTNATRTYTAIIANGAAGMNLIKTGAGTQILSGVNTYTGSTTISQGTLTLGVDNALSDSSNVVIGAGTLKADPSVDDTLGTLDVTAAATINLGTGAKLVFANSNAVDWAGGSLHITGDFVPGSSLNFGIGGLTSTQLGLITVAGVSGPFTLDAAGFLTTGSAYQTWSGGAAFDLDANNDGVDNGIAWILGAANPDANATALLPTLDNTSDPDYFIFTYRRADAANTPGTTITVQYGTGLAAWTTAVDNDDIDIIVTDNHYSSSPGVDRVQVKLRRSTLASGGKLFARLQATP